MQVAVEHLDSLPTRTPADSFTRSRAYYDRRRALHNSHLFAWSHTSPAYRGTQHVTYIGLLLCCSNALPAQIPLKALATPTGIDTFIITRSQTPSKIEQLPDS